MGKGETQNTMKKWKQKLKYMTAVASGAGALCLGSVPAAAATPSMLIGEVRPVNIVIPVVAVVICCIAFLYGKFHKRDDD